MMECLFCKDLRKNCKPELGKGLLCSRCFQVLNSTDQENLKRLYDITIEEGNTEKTKMVKNFLVIKDAGGTHDRKTKKSKRSLVRRPLMRLAKPAHDKLWS